MKGKNMESTGTVDALSVSTNGVRELITMRKWTLFLAIVGFIGSGFTVIAGLLFAVFSNFIPHEQGMPKIPGILFSGLYLVLGVIYFLPSFFLLNFSSKAKKALETGIETDLEEALKYLRFHFTFMGVFVIICIAMMLLVFVGAVVIGVFSAMHSHS